jgi:hypothetical protein
VGATSSRPIALDHGEIADHQLPPDGHRWQDGIVLFHRPDVRAPPHPLSGLRILDDGVVGEDLAHDLEVMGVADPDPVVQPVEDHLVVRLTHALASSRSPINCHK